MGDGNGARGASSLRRNCTRVEGNRAGDTGSLRRYCTVKICHGRRRSPRAQNRGNLCCVIGPAGSRYTSVLRNKRRSPRQRYRRTVRVCRTGVEPSISSVESTWLTRVWVSARVVGSPYAHSSSRSKSRRGGRGWDTIMVARRVWVTGVTAVTVNLAFILVVPPGLTLTFVMI